MLTPQAYPGMTARAAEWTAGVQALNRGVLMTPFHNMALMSPVTGSEDVERHTVAFREAVASLFG